MRNDLTRMKASVLFSSRLRSAEAEDAYEYKVLAAERLAHMRDKASFARDKVRACMFLLCCMYVCMCVCVYVCMCVCVYMFT